VESGPIHAARAQDAAGRCRFSNYFVTDSLCCPSRSLIFTGRFPHDTGIFRNTGNDGGFMAFLNRHHEQSTFATPLQAVGYRTAMLGQYLNGYEPAKDSPEPGWSMWAVAGNGCPEFNYGLNEDGKVAHYGREPTDYLTDVLSGKAVNFIMIEIATFAPRKPYTPAQSRRSSRTSISIRPSTRLAARQRPPMSTATAWCPVARGAGCGVAQGGAGRASRTGP
jgi:hypothetical protein